jgi:hypothetical protein
MRAPSAKPMPVSVKRAWVPRPTTASRRPRVGGDGLALDAGVRLAESAVLARHAIAKVTGRDLRRGHRQGEGTVSPTADRGRIRLVHEALTTARQVFGLPVDGIRNREVAGGIPGANRDHTDATVRDSDDRPVCALRATRNSRGRFRYDVAFGTDDANENPSCAVWPPAGAGHRPRQGEARPNSGPERHLARKSGLDSGFGRGARRDNEHAGNQAR